ncbi:MAG: ATP-dependent helicase UvrD/PcrA [Chthoniobacter sp.]|nr:ATP-dependent helicase UvrD/PcrA [Chthoniobacter sp.]
MQFLRLPAMSRFSLFDLNPEQERAVRTTEGPLLILAGAGTGKTRVITARAAFLVAQGVAPEHILAVTFTNKAANEMRERLATIVEKEQAKKVTMSTFHALCLRILRGGIDRLGYKHNFSIYDDGDQLGLIKKIITRTAAKDEKLDPQLAKNLISKAKNNGWSAQQDEQTLASAVFARYQAELKQLNAVDFDDLLLLTVKLLNEHPDVRARWQERFRYVMVDEFQDTNKLQLELVSLLAKPLQPTIGGQPNVAVVGDDDQSIYGWRGAEVSNILEFEHHFPNPTVVKLEQNYRSTNFILGTANSLIKNNPRRRPKSLWSAHGDGEKVRVMQMPDDREEAKFVIEDIQRRNFAEQTPWEQFAVLYRMNAQSRLLEENLRRLSIPYRLVGGKSFFDRREIKDVLAYATCLVNTDDDVSLLRIINTPARGIGASLVERALAHSVEQKCSLFNALQSADFLETVSAKARAAIAEFATQLDAFETRIHTPLTDYAQVVRDLIHETGYLADLKRTCKTPDEADSRENNVNEMLIGLAQYQQRGSGSLQGFLDEISLDQEREEEKKDDGRGVTLITLHAAKGLEFPHVYLIGLEEDLLPHSRSKTEGTVDEERRLLYVGITRAMRALTLTWCSSRMKFGSVAHGSPSSFIKELATDFIEHIDLAKLLSTPVAEATAKSRFAQMRALLEKG